MTMEGVDYNTTEAGHGLAYLLAEGAEHWIQVPWMDWLKFGVEMVDHLAGARGDTYLVGCPFERGRITIMTPYRFLCTEGGIRVRPRPAFEGLTPEDVAEERRLNLKRSLSDDEERRYDALRDKRRRWSQPPPDKARDLFRLLPLPVDPAAAQRFLQAIGTHRLAG